MTLLKNLRAIILIVLSLVSLIVILLPFLTASSNLVISSIDQTASCSEVSLGGKVSQVAGQNVKSLSDFNNVLLGIKKGDFVSLLIDSRPANCVANADGSVGFRVSTSKNSGGFNVGSDLGGGIIYNYKPQAQVTQAQLSNIANIIQERALIFGFHDVATSSDSSFVKVAAGNPNVNSVLYPGIFEAKLEENIPVKNNAGKISLGTDDFTFSVSNETIFIANQTVSAGGKFVLDGIYFDLQNVTISSIIVSARVFDNNGITQTLPAQSSLSLNQNNQQYMFVLPISVSSDASNNFQKLASRAPQTLIGGQISIDGTLDYVLDGQILSKLTVPSSFANQPIKTISVIGFSPTQDNAINERMKVLAALDSGVINTTLSLDSQQQMQATKQSPALYLAGISLVFIFIATVLTSTIRYKNLKGGVYSFLFIIMEVLSVLGLLFAEISLTGVTLEIDFFAVAAFSFVAVLSGVHYLVISERIHSGKDFAIKIGYRKLFGANTLFYLISLISTIILGYYLNVNFGVIVFFSIVVDWLLVKSLFENFARKIY